MMNNGVAISYGDIAPGAKENFKITTDSSQFDTIEQLNKYNLNFLDYVNPCEKYSVALDGKATAFPSEPADSSVGLWSVQISNSQGEFESPIVLTLQSEGQYTSQGFTFTFDTYNQVYANRLKIQWFRVADGMEMELDSKVFKPDTAQYFCKNRIDNFNKVVITAYAINMPSNRLKIRSIDYGYGTIFYGNELRDIKLIQAIDPISSAINISSADFTLDSKTSTPYSFQSKQPIIIYYNGELKATTFVKSSKRRAEYLWNIHSEDYIGQMDMVTYYGGVYNGEFAYDVLEDIFKTAGVPYTINEELKSVPLYGHIPITTCRNALVQVAFAVQNVVDTSSRFDVKVFELADDITQKIPLERIMQGQNFVDEDVVTDVEVTMHSYIPGSEDVTAYDSSKSGAGENILVKFSEPLHGLYFYPVGSGEFAKDASGNEIKHSNYAIINVQEGCELVGFKYEHRTQVRSKNNPIVLASENKKVISIKDATLVSSYNIDNILDRCFNWLTRVNTTNLKIVEGKHVQYGEEMKYGMKKYGTFKYGQKTPDIITYDKTVNLGEMIEADTEYLGTVAGRIIKQSFNLNGNIVVKEAVLK